MLPIWIDDRKFGLAYANDQINKNHLGPIALKYKLKPYLDSEELTNDNELNEALNTTLNRTFNDPSFRPSVDSIPNFYSVIKRKSD